jgi:DEAD/DEAH box helicase domain-containing protein
MSLDSLVSSWRADPDIAPNLHTWQKSPSRAADWSAFPADLPAKLVQVLAGRGITALYQHQTDAWWRVRAGENVVLATGTASGKTLGYNLPVLAALLEDPQACALYLFPTKALAQDQLAGINQLLAALLKGFPVQPLRAAIYDGDTPSAHRSAIRETSRLILSNPDMLHTGILPHHTNWEVFLHGLRFVVIDEMHTYRGVFGSHVANVIRRLKRLAAFYGARPQFILTSATIGNPSELAERLIEEEVSLIEADGSGRGERTFFLYNPPVIDPSLGLRKSAIQESVRLTQDLLLNDVQSVVFARSRRSAEILLKYLQDLPTLQSGLKQALRGYRSGYLSAQRREIERGLRDGSVRAVIATNALELGIDIGGLGAAVLVGYPGTIASTWQQVGRAGRGDQPAAAVLVATASPLDQFLAHHPEYFFSRSPEHALINPDHLLILLSHLRCAAFELPFQPGEGFGRLPAEKLKEFLDFLVGSRELHLSDEQYFWMADAYPAAAVSLRSASPENVALQIEDGGQPRLLGEVDLASAPWMVHPHAVYLQEGQQYFVQELDLERAIAALIPVALDYYTEPQRQTEVGLLSTLDQAPVEGGSKGYGELKVTTRVVGFRKRQWLSGETLGDEALELPPTEFQTTGYWLTLSEATIEALRQTGSWSSDANDYGPGWPRLREAVRARDGYRCQICGTPEAGRQHDVHHKVPFRQYASAADANRMDNLITLCPTCHRRAETNVRMRSGLAGLASVLGQLAPLFLMCDRGDLGVNADPQAAVADGQPAVVLYDQVPAGIGFSQKLYELHADLLKRALELVEECECESGCPSCVGPAGENGVGGKQETLAILQILAGKR